MAVRPYKDAKGRARYALEFQQGGRRIHRNCPPGITAAQARELETRLRRELFDVDTLNHAQDVPLAGAIQLWLDSTLPHRKDKTVKSKAHQWEPFIGAATLSSVVPAAQSGIKAWTEDDDLPGMLALAKGVSEQRWPHTVDAREWAQRFYDYGWRIWKEPGGVEPDPIGLMLSWFSNAIMAGYDTAQQRQADAIAALQADLAAARALLLEARGWLDPWESRQSALRDRIEAVVAALAVRWIGKSYGL